MSTLTTRAGRSYVTLKWDAGEWPCVDDYEIQMNVNGSTRDGDGVGEFNLVRVDEMAVATAQGLKSCTAYEVRTEKRSNDALLKRLKP